LLFLRVGGNKSNGCHSIAPAPAGIDVKKIIISQFPDPYNYGRTNTEVPARLPRQFNQSAVNVVQDPASHVWTVFVTKDTGTPPLRPVFVIAPFANHNCAPEYRAHLRSVVAFYSSLKGNTPLYSDIQTWSYDAAVPQSETSAKPAATTLYGSETLLLALRTQTIYSLRSSQVQMTHL